MPDRNRDAEFIADQYRKAKRADPSLTPGAWGESVLPPKMDEFGRRAPRSRRSAASLVSRILRGEANDEATALLSYSRRWAASGGYQVTIAAVDKDGNAIRVANATVTSGRSPLEIDGSPEALAFARMIVDRGLGSEPQGDRAGGKGQPIRGEVWRVPAHGQASMGRIE